MGESDLPDGGPPASFSGQQSIQWGLSTDPWVTAWSVGGGGDSVEEMMCVLQRGHSGDGCDLVSTLCKYNSRPGDLFVLSWAGVRRGRISSELLMCGVGVRSILLLRLVARCLETIDVCSIWRMFVFMSVVVIVWGSVGVFCVSGVVEDFFFSLGVLKYVVRLCRGGDGCYVFCLYCEAWSYRCLCMGSVSVSSCRCLCLVCILWQFSMMRSP